MTCALPLLSVLPLKDMPGPLCEVSFPMASQQSRVPKSSEAAMGLNGSPRANTQGQLVRVMLAANHLSCEGGVHPVSTLRNSTLRNSGAGFLWKKT